MRPGSAAPPPAGVLEAFGASGSPARLAGGRGLAWRVGDIVLKPLDGSPASLEWQASVLPTVDPGEVRLAPPIRARDGRVVVHGWIGMPFLAGEHRLGAWPAVIEVGRALNRAVAHLGRPDFLEIRDDPWAVGDRVAWGDADIGPFLEWPHVRTLHGALRPFRGSPQVIHGDLGGNVLFADGLPPGIIDMSPYWRPAGFAIAIVVADALVWEGADATLLDAVADLEDFAQLLVRALLYRLVTDAVFARADPTRPDETRAYRQAVDIAIGGASY